MKETQADVVVVGGGIAGLAVLARLAERGVRAVLVEREPWLAGHASGRNAAIWRPLEDDETTATLAAQSDAWLQLNLGAAPIERVGLVLAAGDEGQLARLGERARRDGLPVELLSAAAVRERAPVLAGGDIGAGLFVPSAGVLDTHAVLTGLADYARARGGELATASAVRAIEPSGGRVARVQLEGERTIRCGAVVLAAGAWNTELAAPLGSRVVLEPIRRHLVQLDTKALPRGNAVVWRVGAPNDEVYFRAESGGVLASPCDAVLAPPGMPEADPHVAELLAKKLARTAPLLESSRVRRAWACLRTFAPDRELVVGEDPAVAGLHWLGGLGGRGLAVAVAAAGELASSMVGAPSALAQRLSPARFG
jgi:glycine/D-amino acid oxidase-like deaminating enzyme